MKPGRPFLTPEEHKVKLMTYMHPDLAAWLRAQPLGISATISALIEKAMKKK